MEKLTVKKFGVTEGGDRSYLYVLRNDKGLVVTVTDYGATLVNVLVPDKNGEIKDVVLGYDDVAGYEKNGWVKRIRSNEDRRTVTIQVTDTIREKILSKWKEHQEALSCFLDELGEEDCESIIV